MIIHSPESPMPEPYRTYVAQRATSIADTLSGVVGETDVQLCPRPILEHEQIFNHPDALLLGSVVDKLEHGDKSVLYKDMPSSGIVAYSIQEAADYARTLFERGERVHFKDPRESDGNGQVIAVDPEAAAEFLAQFDALETAGIVVMPHLAQITDRYAIGGLALGQFGSFLRYGRELITQTEGRDAYGGTDIAMARTDDLPAMSRAENRLLIPPRITKLARAALRHFATHAKRVGYASVDILAGYTDSGRHLEEVVDLTSRVGGVTPAEAEVLVPLHQGARIAYGYSRLYYNPLLADSGHRYIDTPSLVITANVTETEGARS